MTFRQEVTEDLANNCYYRDCRANHLCPGCEELLDCICAAALAMGEMMTKTFEMYSDPHLLEGGEEQYNACQAHIREECGK